MGCVGIWWAPVLRGPVAAGLASGSPASLPAEVKTKEGLARQEAKIERLARPCLVTHAGRRPILRVCRAAHFFGALQRNLLAGYMHQCKRIARSAARVIALQ